MVSTYIFISVKNTNKNPAGYPLKNEIMMQTVTGFREQGAT